MKVKFKGAYDMKNDKPFIHLFATPGGYYIYDVNTNAIIAVEKSIYDFFKASQIKKTNELEQASCSNIQTVVEKLKKRGFLSSKRVQEIYHPANDWLKDYMSSRIPMITLQVTQNCNLRCDYCLYSGSYYNREHSNTQMSFETAKKCIDFLLNNSKDTDLVYIGFYGGEPLLEFDLIKKCVAYADEIFEGKKVIYSITTNGTVFTKENFEFLMEHDANIMISLDGPKDVHNKNRKFAVGGCGSFEKISGNLKYFKENYPEYFKKVSFNCVLDGKNDFGCINEFFASYDVIKGSHINVSNLSDVYTKYDNDSAIDDYNIKVQYELFKLYLNKINKLDKKHVSKLMINNYNLLKRKTVEERILLKELPDKTHHGGPCIAGAQRLFVDVNGNFYPCERVSESSKVMRIGHVDTGFDLERVSSLLNIGKLTEESCKDCWALRFCTVCAAYADDTEKLSCDKKSSCCASVRVLQEQNLKDFCILRELGHRFEEDSGYIEMEA